MHSKTCLDKFEIEIGMGKGASRHASTASKKAALGSRSDNKLRCLPRDDRTRESKSIPDRAIIGEERPGANSEPAIASAASESMDTRPLRDTTD